MEGLIFGILRYIIFFGISSFMALLFHVLMKIII